MKCASDSWNLHEKLSLHARQHRLQLLRAWLLHFIGSLDYYMMECVLESAHLRFDVQLQQAKHLGQVIEAHSEYIDAVYSQCLQQPSAAFLRDAISEVTRTFISNGGIIYIHFVWLIISGFDSFAGRFCRLDWRHFVAAPLSTGRDIRPPSPVRRFSASDRRSSFYAASW